MKLQLAATSETESLDQEDLFKITSTTDYSLDLSHSILSANQIKEIATALKKRQMPLSIHLNGCKVLSNRSGQILFSELASPDITLMMLSLNDAGLAFNGKYVETILRKVTMISLGGNPAQQLNLMEIFAGLHDNPRLYKLSVHSDEELTAENARLLASVVKWRFIPLSLDLNLRGRAVKAFLSTPADKEKFIAELKTYYELKKTMKFNFFNRVHTVMPKQVEEAGYRVSLNT